MYLSLKHSRIFTLQALTRRLKLDDISLSGGERKGSQKTEYSPEISGKSFLIPVSNDDHIALFVPPCTLPSYKETIRNMETLS